MADDENNNNNSKNCSNNKVSSLSFTHHVEPCTSGSMKMGDILLYTKIISPLPYGHKDSIVKIDKRYERNEVDQDYGAGGGDLEKMM